MHEYSELAFNLIRYDDGNQSDMISERYGHAINKSSIRTSVITQIDAHLLRYIRDEGNDCRIELSPTWLIKDWLPAAADTSMTKHLNSCRRSI